VGASKGAYRNALSDAIGEVGNALTATSKATATTPLSSYVPTPSKPLAALPHADFGTVQKRVTVGLLRHPRRSIATPANPVHTGSAGGLHFAKVGQIDHI
jgi:hypothetical protein